MAIYLPIAGISIDVLWLLGLGGIVGVLSGMFGVGGGFLLTPFLIFLGVPPTVAVATGANQVVGASVAGVIAHWQRGNVDFRMGIVLLVGGLIGSGIGILVFGWLQRSGQADLLIQLSYVIFLGFIGVTMAIESVRALMRGPSALPRKAHRHPWHGLPFKMKFPRSGLYISVLLPLGVGAFGGVLAAVMGVGGGFVMVPLMIYILEMPTRVVIGTSLFQIIFVTANVTILQAIHTLSVDVVLMLILLLGGVIGAQFGTRLGAKLRGEQLRALLALLVLGVCLRLAFDLVRAPGDLYSLVTKLS
jgi:uncharacterized membrane protein YfcA